MKYLKLYENFDFNDDDFDFEEDDPNGLSIYAKYIKKGCPQFYHFLISHGVLDEYIEDFNKLTTKTNPHDNMEQDFLEAIEDTINDGNKPYFIDDGVGLDKRIWEKLYDEWLNEIGYEEDYPFE